MRFLLLLSLIIGFSLPPSSIQGQETGIQLNSPEATIGYTLFSTFGGQGVILIDNCGMIVNQWPNVSSTNLMAKLLPDGHLLYAGGSFIYELDWEGELVNSVELVAPDLRLQYEQIRLPNGNYLTVGRRFFSFQQFVDIGYDLSLSTPTQVDVILELDATTGEVVWEWNIADHVIQERDESAPNYGVVADHPELLNMDAIGRFDWTQTESFMINSFDYNPELDQIMVSIRKMSELAIIDHSTTTEEAAGHTGGQYGKGGDILYRWGNPANYGRGTAEDRTLYFQHNPNWVKEGSDAGKITCFNNGLNRPDVTFEGRYSDLPLIVPPVDESGNYVLAAGAAFGPTVPELLISGEPDSSRFYSGYLSGSVVLPNGNFFASVGQSGRLVEFTHEGSLVWEFVLPNNGSIYRAEKYPENYSAFEGRDLSPTTPVPFTNSTYECELLSSTSTFIPEEASFSIQHFAGHHLQVKNKHGRSFRYVLFDALGRPVLQGESSNSTHQVLTSNLGAGLYILGVLEAGQSAWGSYKILIQ